eukprot:7434328-Pyramimonas_sp.AAC.1
MAFMKRLTYEELAEATGEKERVVCSTLPPGSAFVLRSHPWTRALRRVEALLAAPQAKHRHQGCTQSLLTEAQKDHRRLWSQTHVLRRGVRGKQ